MCGIAGLVSCKLSKNDAESRVMNMTTRMAHRGPDSDGFWSDEICSLGHRRLAVIDTSEAGRQPMGKDGVQLVFNGELYNFRDERQKLEESGIKFHSGSDAEVLLELYMCYGENCLSRLRGMYSFAIWDSRKNKLFCARDPLGIKPFLYSVRPEGFVFASELKGILGSGCISKEINRGALCNLLRRGSIPQPETILPDVSHLLPGEYLSVRPGEQPIIKRFYFFKTNAYDFHNADWNEILSTGREILEDALERQLVADVPLGAFLSGGIDSSLLVALMSERHGKVKTFSIGFEDGLDTQSENEVADATNVARHLGVEHTEVIISQADAASSLRQIAKGLDHPTVDGVNSWFVSQVASSNLTVAISGTGGDELFAGYPWFKAMQDYSSASWWNKFSRWRKGKTFESHFESQYYIFNTESAGRLCGINPPSWYHPDPLRQTEPLSRVTGMLLSGYTRDQLLSDIDTASMCHGLEVRVPLLDEKLLDFALSLPAWAKIVPGNPLAPTDSYAGSGVKRILMEMGRPLLPNNFDFRSKRGFTLPFDGWLRSVLRDDMRYLLSREVVNKRGLFDFNEVESIFLKFENRLLHWTSPWLLMMVELWAQEILDN